MSTLVVGHFIIIIFSQSDIAIHAEILAIMIHCLGSANKNCYNC